MLYVTILYYILDMNYTKVAFNVLIQWLKGGEVFRET